MKKNKNFDRGFTLIEVLISIVILSLIAIITSNFLQSSIQSRDFVSAKSQEIYEFNLLTNTLNEDLINAVNIPLTNFRGDIEMATFIGSANTDSFSFITKVNAGDFSTKSLRKVQYILENQSLLRRQYYAAAPANPSEYLETVLFKDIDNLELEFADKTRWYYVWPQGPITQRQIPTLVKISIKNNQNESFAWIINPHINTVYE
ncbi:MAG: prepilin-type N-terminal cleavage/methylation domain-containing protein [Proteobacteria bacterium]|nr:prepilin-type N-terminal cleavage/methylation domain-containing protein [Gammaproteobacteria bacterium]NBW83931.1 prepilin-type N-terminal cleavage/methylation domain-containing protein [Pseudomonadota bacterium]